MAAIGSDPRRRQSETVDRWNELLQAERAGVEVGAALKRNLPKGYFRNHLAKIEAGEAVCCAGLEHGIRALGGEPVSGANDFTAKVAALPDLPAKLELLARGQAWVVKRVDLVLQEELPDDVREELLEMRREHVANIDWCNEQVAELRAGLED